MLAPIFTLAILTIALVLSGPSGHAAPASASGETLVELCVDGTVQVVRLGADGEPVPASEECRSDHACCIATELWAQSPLPSADPGPLSKETKALLLGDAINFEPRFLFPLSRAPPAARTGQAARMDTAA